MKRIGSVGLAVMCMVVTGVLQAAHFTPYHEMTYSQSNAQIRLLPSYDPNELNDPQSSWQAADNSCISSSLFAISGSAYVQSGSESNMQFTIETDGSVFTDNRVHLTADADSQVAMTTDEGLSAYAWAHSGTVEVGTATGNFYTIEADASESVGDVVSVTFDYSALISANCSGGSSYSAFVYGNWAGDDVLVTLNCADLDNPQPSEIVYRVVKKDTPGSYTDTYTFDAKVGDVIGLHAGVIATAYTGTNPGSSQASASTDMTLTLSPGFTPSMADFDKNGRVDLADFALFASAWLWEEPVNDTCENAAPMVLGTHYTGTTNGMADDSVWYSFTPAVSGFYTVSICNGGDYYVEVYDGCDGNYLNATDNDCQIVVWMDAGEDYLISVYGYEVPEDYDLFITQGAAAPSNDDCGSAEVLYDYAEGTTLGATGSDESSCGSNDTHDVWYVFTPESTGYYYVDLYNNSAYFPFDGTLTVYDGDSCDPLPAELDCGEVSGDYVELSDVEMVEAQTYLIRVAGDGPGTGIFGVEVYESGY